MSANPNLLPASRAERAQVAADLKASGLNGLQIAERMGVSKSYAYKLLADPSGESSRARKELYRGICIDCGAATSYAVGGPAERCIPCAATKAGAERKVWTRQAIIDAIRAWAAAHGEPPAVLDWNVHKAREVNDEARARRFEAGGWPSFTTVYNEFGSWSAALSAAGFEPRVAGGGGGNGARRRDVIAAAERATRIVEFWNQGLRVSEIAARVGMPPSGCQSEVCRLRARGYDLPYRRKPRREQVAA